MKLRNLIFEISKQLHDFNELVYNSKSYNSLNVNSIKIKTGHILDNIPKYFNIINIPSSLFEKESDAWANTAHKTIAYHDRPTDDKYWNDNIHKRPPVLVGFDDVQLRVQDGNHRLNVYLSKGYDQIPAILTDDAKQYLKTFG